MTFMFLGESDQKWVEWLKSISREETLLPSQVLCNAQDEVVEIYYVLEGALHCHSHHSDGSHSRSTNIRQGEMIGDVSWITNQPHLHTVIASEQTHILAIPCLKLEEKLASDDPFAKRFFQALSKNYADRFTKLETAYAAQQRQDFSPSQFPELYQHLRNFKALFARIDKAISQNGIASLEEVSQLKAQFRSLSNYINTLLGESSELDSFIIDEIGQALQHSVLPLILLSESADRFYSKPRGYAGDYLSILKLYENQPKGSARMGALIDECWLTEPAAQAVRNRRPLMKNLIEQVISSNLKSPTQITSMACGPAAEVFDVYDCLEDKTKLQCHLIDIDYQALAYVADQRDSRKLGRQIHLHNSNLIYLATGRKKLDLPPQHLVYSVGLIDYFNDKFVVALINFAFDILSSGGRVVLGNFHPRNPTRAVMDQILEWHLIHRTEEDMHRLFLSSKFGKAADKIHFEPLNVNLFAECKKP